MKRKIILNLAISLDGYIADQKGNYDWIRGSGPSNIDTTSKWDYKEFLEGIDTIVMGYDSFKQNLGADFKDKQLVVATNRNLEDHDNVHFISKDITGFISDIKKKPGKNIYLFGGGKLAHSFIKEDLIDEYIVGVIPVILGQGIPLFHPHEKIIRLELKDYMIEDGVVILIYRKEGISG